MKEEEKQVLINKKRFEGSDFRKIYHEIGRNDVFQKSLSKSRRIKKPKDDKETQDKFIDDFVKLQEESEALRLSKIGQACICKLCEKTFYKSKGMGKIKRGLQPHHAVTCRKCRKR